MCCRDRRCGVTSTFVFAAHSLTPAAISSSYTQVSSLEHETCFESLIRILLILALLAIVCWRKKLENFLDLVPVLLEDGSSSVNVSVFWRFFDRFSLFDCSDEFFLFDVIGFCEFSFSCVRWFSSFTAFLTRNSNKSSCFFKIYVICFDENWLIKKQISCLWFFSSQSMIAVVQLEEA